MSETMLEVKDLAVCFGRTEAVRGVSFSLDKGETLALVGESGSGKSVTALSVLQLLPYPMASHPRGSIRFHGDELVGAKPGRLRSLRGGRVGMIFQEPMTSLNPLHNVEKQIGEVLRLHRGLDVKAARPRVIELLNLVGLPEPERRLKAFPHELSGGQRQRVMIAMALANDPDLLIADEPTTALDVTVQAQILQLLKRLRDQLGMGLLLITHDFNVVRQMADRVAVMQDGEIVEQGDIHQVLREPSHPYTRRLLDAEPAGSPAPVPGGAPVVMAAEGVRVRFPIKGGVFGRVRDYFTAVDHVGVQLHAGETLGIVGESGSGKSTLAMALLRLSQCDGRIWFAGREISREKGKALRPLRKGMQLVFQDPFGSLSPRLSIGDIVAEGLDVHERGVSAEARDQRIAQALDEVGLDPAVKHRYPHELSGGQRQRVAFARALILKPKLVVLDEPTSALDRSVQAQVIELLRELQRKYGLAYIFISHDLAVVRAMSHRIMVMKDGRVVEAGEAGAVFDAPQASYTQTLLKAALEGTAL